MPPPDAAAAARHPHLAASTRDGWVRVDMHSHTMWSGDCTTTPEEIEEAVVASGIDVLCITDHNAIRGAIELSQTLPCRVIVGEELRTHAGEVIGLFLTERVPFGVSARRSGVADPRTRRPRVHPPPVRSRAPQPARGRAARQLAADHLIDSIEAFNAKTSLSHLNEQAAALARELDLPAGAGSDSHVPEALGAAYVEMRDFDGPQSFLESLRDAVVVGHHFDRARPWRLWIVPSTSID